MNENSQEEENRENLVKKHKKSLENKIFYSKETEKQLTQIKDKVINTFFNNDHSKIAMENELAYIEKYEERLFELNSENWDIYKNLTEHSFQSEPTVKAFSADVKTINEELTPIYNTSISGTTSQCSDFIGVVDTLKNNYSADKEFIDEMVKNTPKDDFWDNVDFIKNEMNKQLQSSGDNFIRSIKSFISAHESEKYKSLMDVRESIFDNFLDIIIFDESLFCNFKWYKTGSNKKKVFCQTKFYIQNIWDDDLLPKSTTIEAERLATNMYDIYGNLSNFGHGGISDGYAEYIVKREVVPTFRNVLEMRL